LKIYHKLLDPDRYVLLKVLGVVCGVTFCIYSIPFFTALFLSVSLVVEIGGTIGKLPIILLFSSISEGAACGASGFLMSLIVVFISRSREIKTAVFAAVIVAFLLIIGKFMFMDFLQQPPFFKVYWLLDIILSVVFLLGFAILGAWLLNRRHRLKIQKVERSDQ